MFGGFKTAAIDALAHLREAWVKADGHNAPIVQAAITALLCCPNGLADDPETCRRVLACGLTPELANELWEMVKP